PFAQSKVEESPGSTKRGWRVTPARRGSSEPKPRESATESIPPMALHQGTGMGERVRQERTGALVTRSAWQTPPGARPRRGLGPAMAGVFRSERPGLVAGAAGQPVAKMNGCPRVAGPKGYRARDRTRLTGPLALLSESGRERRSGDRPGLAGLGFDIAALRAFKRDRGQAAAHVGARVDADAVAAIFGNVADRMAVHDHFAVAVRMGQERL